MLKIKIVYHKQENKFLLSNERNIFKEQKNSLNEMEAASILITDCLAQETIGSLSLIKRTSRQVEERIREFMPDDMVFQCGVWEGCHLNGPSNPCFYHTLYDGMVKFGKQNGIRFMVLKLTADSYPATKELGLWPYVLEFPPQESFDEFFYGVLPVKGFFYEEYVRKWGEMK